ncbi:hypothetical protein CLAIMM_08313 [Cladophialophora immunda]|nr:hypothetical protein CLAIMM_08313 [Cladophialophora immunda]
MPSDSHSSGKSSSSSGFGSSSSKKYSSSSGSRSSSSGSNYSSRTITSRDYDRLATAVTAAARSQYGTYGGTVRNSNGNYGRRGAVSEADSYFSYARVD